MGYMNRAGRRPAEFASKTSHTAVVRDPDVQAFLETVTLPSRAADVPTLTDLAHPYSPVEDSPVRTVAAVDGGYAVVPVQTEYPSSELAFFQLGVLLFHTDDLDALEEAPFIDPEDMGRLKRLDRFKLTLPIRNMTVAGQPTLTHSVRRSLYDFFARDLGDGSTLLDTLRWFLFEEYRPAPDRPGSWTLASSPYTDETRIALSRTSLRADGTWATSEGPVYLTDVFRLHEAIDDELGAGGILAYVTTAVEQLLLVHVVRLVLRTKPALLDRLLLVKDGPLAFFGQTANLHKPMRTLVCWLQDHHDLYLVGLEKSGAFVEHAHEIKKKLQPGSFLLLSNDYIYRHVIPGAGDATQPYGKTSYYSAKLIFKTPRGGVHVVTVPTREPLLAPQPSDLRHLDVLLTHVDRLRCDMYDDALLPVALANKLVSLSNHPGGQILRQFATGSVPS